MKAALLLEGSNSIKIEDVSSPNISKGEALVKVKNVGICGSDLKIVGGFLKPPSYPFILGHEIAGVVEDAKPSNIFEERLLEEIKENGNRVIVYFYVGCGVCKFCRAGKMNLCENVKRLGFEIPGGLAEYVKVPIRNLVPLPSSLSFESAILADAGASVFHALSKVRIRPMKTVAVMGIGGLGTIAIQLLKIMGATVIALDKDNEKLEFARELGADMTINTLTNDLNSIKTSLLKELNMEKIDLFVDLVGNDYSIMLASNLLGKMGKILQIGYSNTTYKEMPLKTVVYNELEIIGSLGNGINDLYEIVKLASKNLIKLNITDRFKLDEVNLALQKLGENKIKGRAVVEVS